MTNILVTGATGFVGSALIEQLLTRGYKVTALVRSLSSNLAPQVKQVPIGDFVAYFMPEQSANEGEEQNLDKDGGLKSPVSIPFQDVDVVVHTAARAHIMKDKSADPVTEYRKANTQVTLSLARQAATEGVKRFIFISTVKVNGESTEPGKPFSELSIINPTDPYGISKWEAEQGLTRIAEETGMEVVIIRPPLIYGPGVKGNFSSMLKWVGEGFPLPLGRVDNKRSLLALNNLLSFIIQCISHPGAANEVFMLSDREDVSTTELIRKLAYAKGKKPRLLPVPVSWMQCVAAILGKQDVANRLFGSLQISSLKAQQQLDWQPVISIDEQLKKMVDNYHDGYEPGG